MNDPFIDGGFAFVVWQCFRLFLELSCSNQEHLVPCDQWSLSWTTCVLSILDTMRQQHTKANVCHGSTFQRKTVTRRQIINQMSVHIRTVSSKLNRTVRFDIEPRELLVIVELGEIISHRTCSPTTPMRQIPTKCNLTAASIWPWPFELQVILCEHLSYYGCHWILFSREYNTNGQLNGWRDEKEEEDISFEISFKISSRKNTTISKLETKCAPLRVNDTQASHFIFKQQWLSLLHG